MIMQANLFAEQDRLEKLSKLGDSLESLKIIDWELFRPIITKALKDETKKATGRPPFDFILLFKILILQRIYNISDDQTEYQINDRMSFMRFLGLNLNDRVPDAKTIWLFRDNLTKAGVIEKLFHMFTGRLEIQGIITHEGTIVDATFVNAPRQRNTKKENQTIKNGEIPEEWQADTPKAKHKLAQKDTDARWSKKGNETHYGYKNHTKVDADTKLITDYSTTSANVHDSQEILNLIDHNDNELYADSAYRSEEISKKIPKHVKNKIHEKAYGNKPLTDEQKTDNRKKSSVRVRVEHVFGYMTNSMNGINLRCIGMSRAKFNIGLTNLVYNIFRFAFFKKSKIAKG